MNTVCVHLIFGEPYKITQNIVYQEKLSDRDNRYLLIYALIIPSQIVIDKFFTKPLAKGFRKKLDCNNFVRVPLLSIVLTLTHFALSQPYE